MYVKVVGGGVGTEVFSVGTGVWFRRPLRHGRVVGGLFSLFNFWLLIQREERHLGESDPDTVSRMVPVNEF